jgi:hypothetical protein
MRATSEAQVLGDIVGAGVKEKEVMGLTRFLIRYLGFIRPLKTSFVVTFLLFATR